MSLKVWVPESADAAFLLALRAELRAELADAAPEGITLAEGASLEARGATEVLVLGTPTQEHLAACPNLRSIIIPYAGVPGRTRTQIHEHPHLSLHNVHHNAAPTAEMAVTLMLAVLKRVIPMDRALREGDWRPRYLPPTSRTVEGLRVLVLGLGAIGQRVARACLALGMHVEGMRRHGESVAALPEVPVHRPEALHACLRRADVVHVCLPMTEATKQLLDAEALGCLPEGAAVVNVGRGAIIDAEALYALCERGHLSGAGLDVWWRYPRDEAARAATQPADVPLHTLENVVFSPHRAGLTAETENLRARHVAHLLRQLARGDSADHRVDLSAGY